MIFWLKFFCMKEKLQKKKYLTLDVNQTLCSGAKTCGYVNFNTVHCLFPDKMNVNAIHKQKKNYFKNKLITSL